MVTVVNCKCGPQGLVLGLEEVIRLLSLRFSPSARLSNRQKQPLRVLSFSNLDLESLTLDSTVNKSVLKFSRVLIE